MMVGETFARPPGERFPDEIKRTSAGIGNRDGGRGRPYALYPPSK